MSNYPHIAVGRRLFQLRKSERLTQEEIAGRMELSPRHWSDLERGKLGLSRENLLKLSTLFGVSVDYILTGTLASCGSQGAGAHPACPLSQLYARCPLEKRAALIDIMGQIVDAMR